MGTTKRSFGVGTLVAVLVVGLGAGGLVMWRLGAAGHNHEQGAGEDDSGTVEYSCPMHPTVVSDHPGTCPICGMKLVPREPKKADKQVLFYRSPMNPNQTSPVPRKDEMGMDYLPVYADDVNAGRSEVQGLAAVDIDPARQQLIGLRTAKVTRGPIGPTLRTVGKVAVDETRIAHVNVKVDGFVEKVFADFVGKPVRKGEPLFTIYSPDLVSVQNEYLLAVRTRDALREAGATPDKGEELVASARQRLRFWDVSNSDIEALERTGHARRSITVYSPASGVVTVKEIVEGHKLTAGDMPYEISDLSQVWVLADAYEADLARVKVGMNASLLLTALPNRTFDGQVTFIDPVLDPATRTAKVRLSFPNPTGELRPELFGEVLLHGQQRDGLKIPADAVIDSGTRKVVFLALGEGKFMPKEITIGAAEGDQVEVTQGLVENQEVVIRANFLIDSESRLRASLAAMGDKR